MIAVRLNDSNHYLHNHFGHAQFRRGSSGIVLAVFFVPVSKNTTRKIRCVTDYKKLNLSTHKYLILKDKPYYD